MDRVSRLLLVCIGALVGSAGSALGAPPVSEIRPGAALSREITGGAVDILRFPVPADTFVALEIEQDHIDVEITIVEPSGRKQAPVDLPTGETGTERAIFLARERGTYRAAVRAWGGPGKRGVYRTRLTLRPPTARDRHQAEAEETFYRVKEGTRRQGASRKELEAAVAGYRSAARLFAELGERARERDAWASLGDLSSRAGDWREAHDAYGRALPLDRAIDDRRDEARVENELGRSAEELEELAEGRAVLLRAIDRWKALGDRENEARSWINLGNVAIKQGEPREALPCFDQALGLAGIPSTRVRALAGRGGARALGGDFRPALVDFRAALALLGPGEEDLRGTVLTDIGNTYVEAGAELLALPRYAEALSLKRRSGDRYTEAVIWNGLGLAHFRRHENEAALAAYRKTFQTFEALGNRRGEATALINIGWLEAVLGRPQRALESYRSALPIVRQLDFRPAEAALHLGMSWAERARRNRRAARAEAETGIEIIEALRGEADRRDLDGSYLATKQDFYSLLIDLHMADHRTDPLAGHDAESLAVVERARGRSLLDALGAGVDGGAAPLPLPAIERQVLDERTLLLEYHLGVEQSYLWAVSAHGMASFELPARERIETATRNLVALLERGDLRRERMAARQAVLTLGRLLLGPVAGLLGDRPLLIVPDGILFYVPFAALPDLTAAGLEAGAPDGWPEPLAVHHEVTEITSASVLAAVRAKRRGQPLPAGLLGLLADPVTDPADPRLPLGAAPLAPGSGTFPLLASSRSEAEAIVGLAPAGEILTAYGFDADRRRVLSGDLARYRFLHFSTHGVFDPQHPDQSGLVLSRWDRTGRPQEGFLGRRDLEGLRLPAELVVLSACETARGRELRGEGLAGLTQRFFAAGAARVLVSLWRVPDASTAVLMERFYRGLWQEGLSPAAALRQAQASMWREPRFRAPYHWAGFVLQGDPR